MDKTTKIIIFGSVGLIAVSGICLYVYYKNAGTIMPYHTGASMSNDNNENTVRKAAPIASTSQHGTGATNSILITAGS